jgi:hypothetical protein
METETWEEAKARGEDFGTWKYGEQLQDYDEEIYE